MQLSLSLSSLLAGVLVILSMQVVEAAPLERRGSGLVTMPLRRLEQKRSPHPQLVCLLFFIVVRHRLIHLKIGSSTSYQPQSASISAYDWSTRAVSKGACGEHREATGSFGGFGSPRKALQPLWRSKEDAREAFQSLRCPSNTSTSRFGRGQ